mmetsp:Transcript_42269/g.103588  ORF Transcript_42269/g.103588 Transcript_42269/m.103588 type:complete len:216 (-) Transcript_42269:382-1029(-)
MTECRWLKVPLSLSCPLRRTCTVGCSIRSNAMSGVALSASAVSERERSDRLSGTLLSSPPCGFSRLILPNSTSSGLKGSIRDPKARASARAMSRPESSILMRSLNSFLIVGCALKFSGIVLIDSVMLRSVWRGTPVGLKGRLPESVRALIASPCQLDASHSLGLEMYSGAILCSDSNSSSTFSDISFASSTVTTPDSTSHPVYCSTTGGCLAIRS